LAVLMVAMISYQRLNRIFLRTVQRPFDREKYTDTVSKQRLANLAAYLGSKTSPRRYAITNKPQINKNAQN
ncbi:hypothetical protein D6V32_19100, partial [Vibrio cholerae]|nr:hypothetical protein [Vibrio cholerae]MVC35987.1 hypothetical protein [Vibrio cholerae]